mmetsp:Transcript_51615/g.138561  ORF Transcript_51615/g.138561 Transcript_51615/m.138561 type:complete len:155 (-) Transcript_51615:93-557(-)
MIALKFCVCDVFQQIFVVLYIYGWYARNGLRCQMCLFHPTHCESQDPLHWSNFLLCLVTALSSASNQLLIKAKTGKRDDDDDPCGDWIFLILFRFALFSVSVLPFSMAVYVSPFWFHFEHVVVMLFTAAVPLVVGWLTVCCGWTLVVFKDEWEL